MKKEILLAHGERKKIIDELGVTYPTVKSALRLKYNSDMAKKIRKAAYEKGGVLVKY